MPSKELHIIPTYNPSEKFELKVIGETKANVIGYEEDYYIVEKVFGNIQWEQKDKYFRKCLIGSIYKLIEKTPKEQYEQLSLFGGKIF